MPLIFKGQCENCGRKGSHWTAKEERPGQLACFWEQTAGISEKERQLLIHKYFVGKNSQP